MKIIVLALVAICTIASCASNQPENTTMVLPVKAIEDSVKMKFTAASVANKYDFVCGMPVTAGIEDTAHYNHKIYGFCSAECKAEFLKTPKFYTTKKH